VIISKLFNLFWRATEAVAVWRGIRERKEGIDGTEMVYLVIGDSAHLAHAGDEATAPQRVSNFVVALGYWGRLDHWPTMEQ
jgi:hypothetical protein